MFIIYIITSIHHHILFKNANCNILARVNRIKVDIYFNTKFIVPLIFYILGIINKQSYSINKTFLLDFIRSRPTNIIYFEDIGIVK